MEKADDIASGGIPAGNVWTFVPVAVETSQGEVVSRLGAAMLACDDVVDVEWQRVSRDWQVAVFAAAPCPAPNLPYELRIHNYRRRRASRALDCITASRLPTCR